MILKFMNFKIFLLLFFSFSLSRFFFYYYYYSYSISLKAEFCCCIYDFDGLKRKNKLKMGKICAVVEMKVYNVFHNTNESLFISYH